MPMTRYRTWRNWSTLVVPPGPLRWKTTALSTTAVMTAVTPPASPANQAASTAAAMRTM